MAEPVPQPPRGYRDLAAAARSADRAFVTLERRDGYAVVRMDEPEALNPLGAPLTVQLLAHLRELASEETVRAVILTGTDPAFSAGGDLRAMASAVHPMVDHSPEGATAMWRWIRYEFGGVVRLITRTDKLFVAAVNGVAAGVGLAFGMACDLVIASDRARLLTAFGRIGLVPEVGLGWLLTRRLGYHKTMELFVAGTVLSAGEALALGLVNEVVPHDQLLTRAEEWCERAIGLPAHALDMTKPLLRSVADMSWDQAIAMEEYAEPMCFTTQAHRDAVGAMLRQQPGSA
ncbi:MAG: enoyl-CoA hydratase/isomerase family protein [Micromonosporaceae bacterium]